MSFFLWFWSTLRQQPIPRKLGIAVAVIFAVIAAFNAWRGQKRAEQAAQMELARLTVPQLSGELTFDAVAPAGGGKDAVITIEARIQNLGAPSIIKNLGVKAVTPSRTVEAKVLGLFSGPVRLLSADGKGGVVFNSDQYLILKAGEKPIATGGAVTGFLQALAYGVTREEIFSGGYVELDFEDVNGKPYTLRGKQLTGHGETLVTPARVMEGAPHSHYNLVFL